MEYILLFLAILANIIAQIMLKLGSNNFNANESASTLLDKIKSLVVNPYFVIAIFFYGLAFLVYFIALNKIDISNAYPLVSISVLISIFIISVIFLNESFSLLKGLGIVICCLGIGLIFYKN